MAFYIFILQQTVHLVFTAPDPSYRKNLDEEFRYFKEHAHENTMTEPPFPYLVL